MANRHTDKETISHSEYLQLLGLLELARRVNDQSKSIIAAAAAITGDKDNDLGLTGDECYSTHPSADNLLQRLEIKVADA